MVLEAGVDLLFGSHVTGVKVNGKKIEAISVSNVSGTCDIYADRFIDATGDANVAALAGFPFELGRKSDGLCQPMTLSFRLYGVSREEYLDVKDEVNALYAEFKNQGKITNPRDDVLVLTGAVKNVLQFNSTRVIMLDPTNAEDVTKAEIIAREQVFELYDFLRDNFDVFKKSYLISTGMQIGVCESRRIVGEYTVDSDELVHEALASLRVMPTVCTMGEAAGVAAAISCDDGVPVGKINVEKLRDILKSKGNIID